MGDIKLGNSTVNKIYYGNSEVSGLYLGSEKIYPNAVVIPYKYWWRIRGYSSPIVADYSNSFGPTDGTVSLVGTSYGRICASQNSQYVFYTNNTVSQAIRISSNYGASFSASNLTGQFQSIACSDSGQYIIAASVVAVSSRWVAISINYGDTWSWVTNTGIDSTQFVAVNRSGQYMYAIPSSATYNQRYYSHDYGATWTSAGDSLMGGTNVICSGDGRYVYYWSSSGRDYYVSSDFGVTYTKKTVPSATAGNGFTCSDDGKYVYYYTTTAIYRSSDYGATWSSYAMAIARSVSTSCSYDGKHVVMRISDTQFAISDDYGVTFRTENYTCNTTGLWVSRM